jgi:hypothetical protein
VVEKGSFATAKGGRLENIFTLRDNLYLAGKQSSGVAQQSLSF